jgi:hypothetical protein
MKRHLLALTTILTISIASAQVIEVDEVYRCGNEYTNTIEKYQEATCVLVTGDIFTRMAHNQSTFVFAGKTDEGNLFLDKAAITKVGAITKVLGVLALTKTQMTGGKAYASRKSLNYYDCKAMTVARKQLTLHADDQGMGIVVSQSTTNDKDLTYSAPKAGSIGAIVLKQVCSGKIGLTPEW